MLKFCGCKNCRAGRHTPRSKAVTRKIVKGNRTNSKVALRFGKEVPPVVSVPYTD